MRWEEVVGEDKNQQKGTGTRRLKIFFNLPVTGLVNTNLIYYFMKESKC